MTSGTAVNTNREIWRERPGDFYADQIFVTATNNIGIDCGGSVYVKPVREWHKLETENARLREELELCVCLSKRILRDLRHAIDQIRASSILQSLKDRYQAFKTAVGDTSEYRHKLQYELSNVTVSRDLAVEKSEHLSVAVEKLLQHCPDAECVRCGEIVCPYTDPLHFHHDGCPSCESNEPKTIKNGFSLIEVAIALFCISLFATVALPMLTNSVMNSQLSKMRGDFEIIKNGIAWTASRGRTCAAPETPPCTVSTSTYLIPPAGTQLTAMGFQRSQTLDPWGNPYRWVPSLAIVDPSSVPSDTVFTLASVGADGLAGTADDFQISVSVSEIRYLIAKIS